MADFDLQLFDTTRILFPQFPQKCVSTRYAFGKGIHEFPFTIDFPLLSSFLNLNTIPHTEEDGLLPPTSLKTGTRRYNGNGLIFLVQATVTKCGLFRRQVCRNLELNFLTLDSPTLVTNCGMFSKKASRFISCSLPKLDDEFPTLQGCGYLPLYSPSIMLEATISSSGSFCTGDPIPLQITVSVPRSISSQLTIRLKSLQLILHHANVSRTGGNPSTLTISDFPIQNIQTDLLMEPDPESEIAQLDSSLWQDCRVPGTVSRVTMSDQHRQFLLQIHAGFSSKDFCQNMVSLVRHRYCWRLN